MYNDGLVGLSCYKTFKLDICINVHLENTSSSNPVTDDFGQMRLLDILLKEAVEDVIVHRVPMVHRGVKVHCDVKGRNFCVLQAMPNVWYE